MNDARRWRDIVNAVSTFLDEAEFMASTEGLILRAMDSSQVAMVDLFLPNAFFDEYECTATSEYVRINLKNMLNILGDIGARESLSITYLADQARLVISLRGEYERIFSLTTLATEGRLDKEPNPTFKVKAQLKAEILKRVTADSQKIGEQMNIEAKADSITFQASGLIGSSVSSFKKGNASLIELSLVEESKATYSLDLLGAIIKNASSVSEKINVEYSTNNILRLDFVIPQGKLHFYLSPMLESQ